MSTSTTSSQTTSPSPVYDQASPHLPLQTKTRSSTSNNPPAQQIDPRLPPSPSPSETRKTRRSTPTKSTRRALIDTLSSSEPCELFSRGLHTSPSISRSQLTEEEEGDSSKPAKKVTFSSPPETPGSEELSPARRLSTAQDGDGLLPRHVRGPSSELSEALVVGRNDVTIKHRDRMLVVREAD